MRGVGCSLWKRSGEAFTARSRSPCQATGYALPTGHISGIEKRRFTPDGRVSDRLRFATAPLMPAPTSNKVYLDDVLSSGAALSVVSLVDALIAEAQGARASDIHIDPSESKVRIRMRIDGVLQDRCSFEKILHPEVIARIKVLARMRTDEHQKAQDGRFRVNLPSGSSIDIRVSIAPTYFGENVVLRLLSDKADEYTLEKLGFNEADQKKVIRAIRRPHGMILATGPTGSGKTTTLYTLVKMLNTKDVSIVTIEDPIEYAIGDIRQIQVNSVAGLTFANGLRSILRQDPNVIMVGEIRDSETAGIAVNTALTGHLLLSTLHTSDAATTLPRLLDMGIDSYLVASTVNLAIGQRLVRKICDLCKVEDPLTDTERENLLEVFPERAKKKNMFYKGKGCEACGSSGYKGRIGVNEVLVVDQEVRDAILKKAPASTIKAIAVKNGMTTMLHNGFERAFSGDTTIAEVLRVINE